jgi:hypothetical protein
MQQPQMNDDALNNVEFTKCRQSTVSLVATAYDITRSFSMSSLLPISYVFSPSAASPVGCAEPTKTRVADSRPVPVVQ